MSFVYLYKGESLHMVTQKRQRSDGSGRGRLFVVVDGQYGSTGKGKAVQYLASHYSAGLGVRCGGPNAGHTVDWDDIDSGEHRKFVTRSLCSALTSKDTLLAIAAGSVLDFSLLCDEIERLKALGVRIAHRLYVDSNTFLVSQEDIDYERSHGFGDAVGSTQTGGGSAMMRRIARKPSSGGRDQARHLTCAKPFNLASVPQLISNVLDEGSPVIIEGTQGYGLSVYHGGCWPFATGRDTTAAAFCSEAGVGPLDVTDVIMVIRTHPIRVGGNSGPIANEIDWETVATEADWPESERPTEITSVTKKIRRVGRFDWDQYKRAIQINRPSAIALHGVDYLNWKDRGRREIRGLSNRTCDFINQLERVGKVPVRWVMTGPRGDEIIDTDPNA